MYFADSVKVDLDIAGNGGGGRGQRNCEEIEIEGGGGGWNSRLGRAIVRSSKPPYYAGYCLAVTP